MSEMAPDQSASARHSAPGQEPATDRIILAATADAKGVETVNNPTDDDLRLTYGPFWSRVIDIVHKITHIDEAAAAAIKADFKELSQGDTLGQAQAVAATQARDAGRFDQLTRAHRSVETAIYIASDGAEPMADPWFYAKIAGYHAVTAVVVSDLIDEDTAGTLLAPCKSILLSSD